ncbi:MAG: hypothetical protein ABS52_16960 [Gemmatimonadetes bacterium SCN 70-22]|nr:MAG: hypothetical protein ABS52_16960 [Gemmatimonadetes bacterium SCN 70-22]
MVNGLSYAPLLRPAGAPAPREALESGAPGNGTVSTGNAGQAQRAGGAAPTSQPRLLAPATTPEALPVEPPPGTDPQLWMVLSAEERAHFARLGAMGPLTYGRALEGQTPTSNLRGMRLDIRG